MQVARAKAAKAQMSEEHRVNRKDYLAYRTSYEQRLGFDFLEHHQSEDLMTDVKPHAVKKEILHVSRRPPLNTHDRIFGKKPVVENPLRTQHLHDQRTGGKPYNIVSHTALSNRWEPTYIHEADRVNKRLSHESQASLERGRNLQGAFPPTERCATPFLDPWY